MTRRPETMAQGLWTAVATLLSVAACVLSAQSAPPFPAVTLKLANVFAENAVLQREREIPVWGWAAPGAAVQVQLGDARVSATADMEGKWRVNLPPRKAGGPFVLKAESDGATVTRTNVLVGDVWLCSGQSNMEMGLGSCMGAADDIRAADFPHIRWIKAVAGPMARPAADVGVSGPWRVASPATAASFNGVGFYFAREVNRATGVPIGLIETSASGVPIGPFWAPEGLASVPELKAVAEQIRQTQTPGQIMSAYALYNSRIRPLVPYAIKGVLWYQGENNGFDGDLYFHKMRALIDGWRTVWGQGDFPFYFVQLPAWQKASDNPAGDAGWNIIRAVQAKVMAVTNTGMAVAIDVGDAVEIHPTNKYDVGRRLALWALARDYGMRDLVYSGPMYRQMKVEGAKVRLSFDHLGGGLMVGKKEGRCEAVEDKEGKLARFAVAGGNKVWQWAEARIEGDSVIVWSDKIPEPVAVRYAYSWNPAGANLYNRAGLPACPFRTDNW